MKICPECGTEFEPKYKNSKYDKKECRDKARRRRERPTPVTAEEKSEVSIERKVLSLEASKATADKLTKAAKLEVAKREEDIAMLRHELALYQRGFDAEPAWLKTPKDTKEHHGTLVAFMSDPHVGEVVSKGEMDGFNAYDMAIAELRMRRFFERSILVARHYLAGVKYDGIVLALGGDMVSGDIHEELQHTNECSVYESIEAMVPWLVAGVNMLAEEFGNVRVVSVPGNHGRDSKKPRHKKRSAHNADTHAARLVAQHFKDSKTITFSVPASFDVGFKVYDWTFSMEHGDNMRFSGTSEIGAFGPAKRGTLRKSRQAQTEGRPFHYNLMGHFHQYLPAYTQGLIMNGSIKGYDEYARSWHFLPEPPQQSLSVVTPEHGITVQAPVLVQSSKEKWS